MPRIRQILKDENVFIQGLDTDRWADEYAYQKQSGPDAFQSYLTARRETIELLSTLSDDHWNKTVQHAIFGPTNLLELARIMAGHDRLHIAQIHSLLR